MRNVDPCAVIGNIGDLQGHVPWQRLLNRRVPRGNGGILEIERNIEIRQSDGSIGCTLRKRPAGVKRSCRCSRHSGGEIDHAPGRVQGRAVASTDRIERAGLDGIVIGVAVVHKGNKANAESSADNGLLGCAIRQSQAGSEVSVIGFHPDVGGVTIKTGGNQLVIGDVVADEAACLARRGGRV